MLAMSILGLYKDVIKITSSIRIAHFSRLYVEFCYEVSAIILVGESTIHGICK